MSAVNRVAALAAAMKPDVDPGEYAASFGCGAAYVWAHPIKSVGHRVVVDPDLIEEGDLSPRQAMYVAAVIAAAALHAANLDEQEAP